MVTRAGFLSLIFLINCLASAGISEIAKNPDGSVLRTNKSGAERYCKEQGMRLPTAREFALFAQSLGATGITTPSANNPYSPYLILGSDSLGHADRFYFDNGEYQTPTGDFGKYIYWSSSVHPGGSDYAYYMDGFNGYIRIAMHDICAPDCASGGAAVVCENSP